MFFIFLFIKKVLKDLFEKVVKKKFVDNWLRLVVELRE